MNKNFIRLIAVCFLFLGLWNVFLFFQAMWTNNSPNLAHAAAGIILFRTGDNLFSLKEIGRKLAIGILGINMLQSIFAIFLAVFRENFTFTWTGLGGSFQSDNGFLFFALLIPWIMIDVLFGLLLLQEKTRVMFRGK